MRCSSNIPKFWKDAIMRTDSKKHAPTIGNIMRYIKKFGERFGFGVPTTCCYVPVQSEDAKKQDVTIVQFWMYWRHKILRLIKRLDCHHFHAFAFAHATSACALVKPNNNGEGFMVSYQTDGSNYMFAWGKGMSKDRVLPRRIDLTQQRPDMREKDRYDNYIYAMHDATSEEESCNDSGRLSMDENCDLHFPESYVPEASHCPEDSSHNLPDVGALLHDLLDKTTSK